MTYRASGWKSIPKPCRQNTPPAPPSPSTTTPTNLSLTTSISPRPDRASSCASVLNPSTETDRHAIFHVSFSHFPSENGKQSDYYGPNRPFRAHRPNSHVSLLAPYRSAFPPCPGPRTKQRRQPDCAADGPPGRPGADVVHAAQPRPRPRPHVGHVHPRQPDAGAYRFSGHARRPAPCVFSA